ncbi:MAG: paraquat-inducible protein A [Candidatus Omnitrophica bacterium]|nr:paraquat-inducible protein A [Candidatus Omnitrophota bacterium]
MTAPKLSLRQIHPDRREIPALIVLALGVLVLGLSLPILTVEKTVFWRHWENHYSVFVGVMELAIHGDWLLAVILFFFSMVFPFIKIAALAILWYRPLTEQDRKKTLHWLGLLGKWSMLDVFAVAILIVAAKLRDLTQVEPRIGIYLFALAIIFSMLTTMRVERLARKSRPA